MPPKKSTIQNSVVNSHIETESHAHRERHVFLVVDTYQGARISSVVDTSQEVRTHSMANTFLGVKTSQLVDHSRWH